MSIYIINILLNFRKERIRKNSFQKNGILTLKSSFHTEVKK